MIKAIGFERVNYKGMFGSKFQGVSDKSGIVAGKTLITGNSKVTYSTAIFEGSSRLSLSNVSLTYGAGRVLAERKAAKQVFFQANIVDEAAYGSIKQLDIAFSIIGRWDLGQSLLGWNVPTPVSEDAQVKKIAAWFPISSELAQNDLPLFLHIQALSSEDRFTIDLPLPGPEMNITAEQMNKTLSVMLFAHGV